jgi:serine/threonine protein kinase
MAVRIESQAEPIPGYKLIERLGGGGFGEVWKAEAPGGLHKAIKFVYGDLQTDGEDGVRAEQELKALSRVKTVRHPFILSLERYDIIDGQLIIVMELADRNLWDRFRECRSQGLPGIPRPELLGYMEEAAEALDLMNMQYQLQHLDIKPQNLFLTFNHVKVADFGLVKDLKGMAASVTGGVTPVYAAPETFDGYVSRFTDQYSLAIVYQELLTGQRPFTGNNIGQLIMQHLQAEPNLSSLPEADRSPIARSLSKNPDERFPSCLDLVQALRRAGEPPAPPTKEALEVNSGSALPGTRTPNGDTESPSQTDRDSPAALGCRAHTIFRPVAEGTSPPLVKVTHGAMHILEEPTSNVQLPAPEVARDGVLIPALVIGLGHLGMSVLRRLREGVHQRFGTVDAVPHFRCIYLDTDPEGPRHAVAGQAGAALSRDEVLLARLNRPSHYLKLRDVRFRMDTWFDPWMLYRIPRNQVTTGLRALGRLAFFDNFKAIVEALRAELKACTDGDAVATAIRQTHLQLRSTQPRVYVVTGLAGGTGSGMFLDLAYVIRALLKEMGYLQPEVVGLFLLPAADRAAARTLALGNAYAALTELNYFNSSQVMFSARYEERQAPLTDADPPFTRCLMLPLPGGADEDGVKETVSLAADFLNRDLFTPLGRLADTRRAALAAPASAPADLSFQTFAMVRFAWPRQGLIVRVSNQLCQRLVQRWLSKDSAPLRPGIKAWVEEQWTDQRLGADCLIERLQAACEKALGQAPETALSALLEPFAVPGKDEPQLDPAALTETLASLEKLLGRPEEGSVARSTGTLSEALAQAAKTLVTDFGRKLAGLAVCLLEQPNSRLAGAEEAIRQLITLIEQVLHHHEPLAKELTTQAVEAYGRLYALGANLRTNLAGGRRLTAKETRSTAVELFDLLNLYTKTRYQSLVLRHVTTSYVSLRGLLSDQIREVDYCRQPLGELVRLFQDGATALETVPAAGVGRCLFPAGLRTLEEAVNHVLQGVTPEHLEGLDQRVQALIRQQFTALVKVCLASSSLVKELAMVMRQAVESFVAGCLEGTDVAEMFFSRHGSEEEALEDIAAAYEEADPELTGSRSAPGAEIGIVATPPGAPGERFRVLVRRALPKADLDFIDSTDDIVFYRERARLVLTDLKQLGPLGQEAYRQMSTVEHFTPHTRIDISNWVATAHDPGERVARQ